MESIGMPVYSKLKVVYYLLLLTIIAYMISTLSLFSLDLKLVNFSPTVIPSGDVPKKLLKEVRPLQYYNLIREKNLFSVTPEDQDKNGETDIMAQIDDLSLTSLNCTLIGTIIHENGDSWAIIKDNKSNSQDKYQKGSVVSGAKVVLILRNKVVLNIDGRDELLVMGIEKIRAEKAAKDKSGQTGSTGESVTYKIDRNFIRKSMNNLAEIMSNVRVKPHFKDGKPTGFQVSHIKKGSLLQTIGFKDNDVIKSVNGQDIRSTADIMKLYGTLKDTHFYNVNIVRNNQTKTLNFKVR